MFINIQIASEYIHEESIPEDNKYFFQYKVQIQNLDQSSIQLLKRYWVIEDGHKIKKIIQGKGVVGKQPIIHPTKEYSYSSWVELSEPVGTMEGFYEFLNLEDKTVFKQQIPLMSLYCKYNLN